MKNTAGRIEVLERQIDLRAARRRLAVVLAGAVVAVTVLGACRTERSSTPADLTEVTAGSLREEHDSAAPAPTPDQDVTTEPAANPASTAADDARPSVPTSVRPATSSTDVHQASTAPVPDARADVTASPSTNPSMSALPPAAEAVAVIATPPAGATLQAPAPVRLVGRTSTHQMSLTGTSDWLVSATYTLVFSDGRTEVLTRTTSTAGSNPGVEREVGWVYTSSLVPTETVRVWVKFTVTATNSIRVCSGFGAA